MSTSTISENKMNFTSLVFSDEIEQDDKTVSINIANSENCESFSDEDSFVDDAELEQQLELFATFYDEDSSSNYSESSSGSFNLDDYSSSNNETGLNDLLNDSYACHDSTTCFGDSLASLSYNESKEQFKKNVHFGLVTIREYSVTVGACASTNDECPLQLDWEHAADFSMDVRDYSCLRSSCIHESNRKGGLRRLSVAQRRQRIANVCGISVKDVKQVEVKVLMNQISQTMEATCNIFTMNSCKSTPSKLTNKSRFHSLSTRNSIAVNRRSNLYQKQ